MLKCALAITAHDKSTNPPRPGSTGDIDRGEDRGELGGICIAYVRRADPASDDPSFGAGKPHSPSAALGRTKRRIAVGRDPHPTSSYCIEVRRTTRRSSDQPTRRVRGEVARSEITCRVAVRSPDTRAAPSRRQRWFRPSHRRQFYCGNSTELASERAAHLDFQAQSDQNERRQKL